MRYVFSWRSAVKYLSKFDIRINYVFIRFIRFYQPSFLMLLLVPRIFTKLNMDDNNGKIRLVMKMTVKFRKIPILFVKFLF